MEGPNLHPFEGPIYNNQSELLGFIYEMNSGEAFVLFFNDPEDLCGTKIYPTFADAYHVAMALTPIFSGELL